MHVIKICMGSACAQNYGPDVLKRAEQLLGIKAGENTPDGNFRLEKTSCLSQCENAPNVAFIKNNGPLSLVMMDGQIETNMLPNRFEEKLKKLTHTPNAS